MFVLDLKLIGASTNERAADVVRLDRVDVTKDFTFALRVWSYRVDSARFECYVPPFVSTSKIWKLQIIEYYRVR